MVSNLSMERTCSANCCGVFYISKIYWTTCSGCLFLEESKLSVGTTVSMQDGPGFESGANNWSRFSIMIYQILNQSIGKLLYLEIPPLVFVLQKKTKFPNTNVISAKLFRFGNVICLFRFFFSLMDGAYYVKLNSTSTWVNNLTLFSQPKNSLEKGTESTGSDFIDSGTYTQTFPCKTPKTTYDVAMFFSRQIVTLARKLRRLEIRKRDAHVSLAAEGHHVQIH